MNSLNFKTVNACIRLGLFVFSFFVHVQVKAWDVDFSRREKELKSMRMPASIVDQPQVKTEPDFLGLGSLFDASGATQEVVILNTENGFVPSTVRLRKGQNYKFHIVNVNQKDRNTSFILDAFSEHHATYFGQQKSFSLQPKQEGVFSFVCPETAKEGRMVIFSDESSRQPASR